MDRSRAGPRLRRPAFLLAALGLALTAGGLAVAAPRLQLRAERWLAPGADARAVLGRQPTECLARAKDPETAWKVEVGRAAFRSPLIFGGQAAKAGLSCESCHRGGRTNPDFFFPGLSGAPGTADVTSFLMSAKRGDDIANPKPIPDLSGPRVKLKVSQAPESRALEGFIHGIVTEEFEGREPPPAVLAGLAAYVRALSPDACPALSVRVLTVSERLEDVRRAMRAADGALARGDAETADAMLLAARDGLGQIDERYAGPGLEGDRAAIRASDLELKALRGRLAGDAKAARQGIAEWIAGSRALERRLRRDEGRSLFNPARIGARAS